MATEYTLPSALSHFDPTDLLDALSTGIIMLDAQLCAIYANVAAQDLLAFSLNKARGRPFGDFLQDSNGLIGLDPIRRLLPWPTPYEKATPTGRWRSSMTTTRANWPGSTATTIPVSPSCRRRWRPGLSR